MQTHNVDESRTKSTSPIPSYEYSLNALPTSYPTSDTPHITNKRKYQSRIDELFQPTSSSTAKKRRRQVLDSASESDIDALDSFQLEVEKSTDPIQINQVSDADSDDIIGPRVRRQRHLLSSPLAKHPPRTTSPQVDTDEELSQELRDLTSSARKSFVAQRMRDAKTRNKRKSQFQKNLESLRKKKQGMESLSDTESEKGRALYDSASDIDSVASDDFIVEDDQELTLEQMMEIPPEFTSVSYQGPQLNFKIVVQGEVYAVLHPDYYELDYTGTTLLY
jgi:hypothetical protein